MSNKFSIAIHGGCGNTEKFSPEKIALYNKSLSDALLAGWSILEKKGTALDAVQASVQALEDDALFNAGRGSVYTCEGTHELDAAIMCGKRLKTGAVTGIKHLKNPVTLARQILEKSHHAFLAGEGAENYGREFGLAFVEQGHFSTTERWNQLQNARMKKPLDEHGTVGAVAFDTDGNLAAATSTGGLTNKRPGRIGDTPIIGAGTYANNDVCAVSCTGDGEDIMRGCLAHEVYALIKYKFLNIDQAVAEALSLYEDKLDGDKAMIAIDSKGNVSMQFHSNMMFRASRTEYEEAIILF